ncbi:hypothetical protein B9K01_11990 [Staphylococcus capitis]|nr:hypothetical protein B9K01_11990 [Staphylococcus capitis]
MFFIYYNKNISKKKPPAGTLGVFTYNDISAICYFQYILSYAFCKTISLYMVVFRYFSLFFPIHFKLF